MTLEVPELEQRLRQAVSYFWGTRLQQASRQEAGGSSDQGRRADVTGGKQMDGFVDLLCKLTVQAGVPDACVYRAKAIELPGFFRPTKQWDMLVVADGVLLAVLELKSQVGPSFGNNFNNRTEEAVGSAVDLWTAFREGAFGSSQRPWLGYLFLLEDCAGSRSPVSVSEAHFPVFPEFKGASYMKRYELFCRKLVQERHYEAAALLASPRDSGGQGGYSEPADDLSFRIFAACMMAKMALYATLRK